MSWTREQLQRAFVRICEDSGYSMTAVDAAGFTAKFMGCSPMEIWIAMGSVQTMDRIADGSLKPIFKEA